MIEIVGIRNKVSGVSWPTTSRRTAREPRWAFSSSLVVVGWRQRLHAAPVIRRRRAVGVHVFDVGVGGRLSFGLCHAGAIALDDLGCDARVVFTDGPAAAFKT